MYLRSGTEPLMRLSGRPAVVISAFGSTAVIYCEARRSIGT